MAEPAETEPILDQDDGAKGSGNRKVPMILGGICCGCICCYVFVVVVSALILMFTAVGRNGFKAGAGVYTKDGKFITPRDVTEYDWWPGCEYDDQWNVTNCGATCCDCKLREEFRSYCSKAPFKFVWFPSREGPEGKDAVMNITAWWLPDKEDAETDKEDEKAASGNHTKTTDARRRLSAPGPVIVLQHGMGGQSNDGRAALTAYVLRSLGFSVLIHNLRGHGSSESDGKHKSWGSDWPYDLLGAWDYVVKDPENKLGGPRHPSQVGIHGVSMGGFISATAFGLEPNVPALLLDGALYDPLDLSIQMSKLPSFIVAPAFRLMEIFVGENMRVNLPESTLPEACAAEGPKPRHVMLVSSPDDTTVPMEVNMKYARLLQPLVGCYEVEPYYGLGGTCVDNKGERKDHNVVQWSAAAEYRQTLCNFWSKALLNAECPFQKEAPDKQ